MNLLKLAMLALFLTSASAIADEEVERKMQIKVVVAGDGADEASEFSWSSDEIDFDLQDLAIGETRALQNESGRDVSVTRQEDGFSFAIDGKTVMMPNIGEHESHMAFVDTDGADHDVDVQVMQGHAMRTHPQDGVTIISSKPLDASVRESIKSVLLSAGNDDEVTFIDGSEEGKRVIMMRKEVEIL